MRLDQVTIEDINPDFSLDVMMELGFDVMHQAQLTFNNLVLPPVNSPQGRDLRAHLSKVFDSVDFLMALLDGNEKDDSRPADFYYLPANLDAPRRADLPEEDENLERVVREGRHLNAELAALGLAVLKDAQKHPIDFSRTAFTVRGRDMELEKENFKSQVCMYINDCKQYLRAALEGRPVDMMKGEFDPTEWEARIIFGLHEVKEMCGKFAARRPLGRKGN